MMLTSLLRLCAFEVPELIVLQDVWPRAAEERLNAVRRLQHILVVEGALTPSDAELAWANRKHVAGHPRFVVQLFKTVDWSNDACVDVCLADFVILASFT